MELTLAVNAFCVGLIDFGKAVCLNASAVSCQLDKLVVNRSCIFQVFINGLIYEYFCTLAAACVSVNSDVYISLKSVALID